MAKVKKINVISFGKLLATMMAILGLITGIVYSFGGLVIDTLVTIGWVTTSETPGLSYGTILAFGALIGMPVIFAAVGFVVGIILAIFYNLFAKWFGGVKIDFEE